MLAGAASGWQRLAVAAPLVDQLLGDPFAKQQLAQFLDRFWVPKPQFISITVGALVSVGSLFSVSGVLSDKLAIGIASYLSVALTGAIAGAGAYLATALVYFARKLSHSSRLAIRWIDPARTPGIEVLADGYLHGAPYAAAAFALVEIPLLYAFSIAPPHSGTGVICQYRRTLSWDDGSYCINGTSSNLDLPTCCIP